MATDNNSIPFEVVAQLKSRVLTRDETIQIKLLRIEGFTRDDALLAVKGKPEAKSAAIAKYPNATLPTALVA